VEEEPEEVADVEEEPEEVTDGDNQRSTTCGPATPCSSPDSDRPLSTHKR
jgi:hypothetical protein